MAWEDLRREYTCPIWLCGWHIAITGPHDDEAWKLTVAQHTPERCRKRVAELARHGAEIAARDE